MKQWRVDYRTGCGNWVPIGWWGLTGPLFAFLRDQANPYGTFRIRREAC